MQFLKEDTHFDFMGKRKIAAVVSIILVLISLGSLFKQGLNLGVDFTGGTIIELAYQDEAKLDNIRAILNDNNFTDAAVQNFGTIRDVLIYVPVIATKNMAELSNEVVTVLQKNSAEPIDVRRVEFVGPQVGDELAEDGGLAVLYALIGILIYVAIRFEYRFSIGSVVALIHDVIITLGVFSLFQLEFDLTVLAAILAIIGYSLNDTIVVFDRIREMFLRNRKGDSVEIVNGALNDMLSRTLMTSGTTLLVVFSLFLFGGTVIHDFAIALILGIVVGTYSSIYIASTVALAMGVSKTDLMTPVKAEGNDAINEDGSQV